MITPVKVQEDQNVRNSKHVKKISPTHRQSDQPTQDCVKVEHLINTQEEKVDQEKTVPLTEANKAPITSKTDPNIAGVTINLEDSAKEVTDVKATVPETMPSAQIISTTTTDTILPTNVTTNPTATTTIPKPTQPTTITEVTVSNYGTTV
jgi:hypothetical protein